MRNFEKVSKVKEAFIPQRKNKKNQLVMIFLLHGEE